MTIRILMGPAPGQEGKQIAFAGTEHDCGTFMDVAARNVVEAGITVNMQIDANPIPHARLAAYLKFAIAMEKLDGKMAPNFDFHVLCEHTAPTRKPS